MSNSDPKSDHRTDVAVIGAGPTGLFAVFECGMLNMRCHVIDALDAIGGQCAALYPEKPIYDIPGHPSILGQDLVDALAKQAAPFEPQYHLNQRVTVLSETPDGWHLETDDGTRIDAKVVIVAAGVGAFGPNRPPLDGIERFEATRGVRYFVTRRENYRDRRVVIAGGGDSAVDWAISLAEVAKSVALVHRRDRFRAAPDSVNTLKKLVESGAVEMVTPYQLAGLEGTDDVLERVIAADLDGNRRALEADVLLPFYGLSQNLGPIAEWGLNLDRDRITVDPSSGATGLPGIFAIGDVVTYPGKLRLILTGFAEAAHAAHAAHAVAHPGEPMHFEHSTTKGVPAS